MQRFCSVCLVTLAASGSLLIPASAQSLNKIGGYNSGVFSNTGGAAEISAYDPASKRLFSVNAVTSSMDILDFSNPAAPSLISSISFGAGAPFVGSPNSVAVRNGVVAVAVESTNRQNPGSVQFYNAATASSASPAIGFVTVGAVPDMLTFTPDGTKVLVANEGEPSGYGGTNVDPEGSVTIIHVTLGAGTVAINNVQNAGFNAYNGQEATLRSQGIRLFGPGASASQDFEPEYIGVSADSSKAFVTLQENNALATIDLLTGTVTAVKSFGYKDHSLPGNALDASDRDSATVTNGPAVRIVNRPVLGMYQPDGIATFQSGGKTYLMTANEGDAREYLAVNGRPGGVDFVEEARVSTLDLDNTNFPTETILKGNGPNGIGRLTVTNQLGNPDGDGDFEQLYAFGARSFSIWDDQGNLVYDSGDLLERLTAAMFPFEFNSTHDSNGSFDTRSDNKGPEPEGVVIGQAFGRTFGFVGFERIGGVAMFDLTNPAAPVFLNYVNSRAFNGTNFTGDPVSGTAGDLGPEGLAFISAANSPSGNPLLVVSNEISGSVAVFELSPVPEPSTALAGFGLLGMAAVSRWRRPGITRTRDA